MCAGMSANAGVDKHMDKSETLIANAGAKAGRGQGYRNWKGLRRGWSSGRRRVRGHLSKRGHGNSEYCRGNSRCGVECKRRGRRGKMPGRMHVHAPVIVRVFEREADTYANAVVNKVQLQQQLFVPVQTAGR